MADIICSCLIENCHLYYKELLATAVGRNYSCVIWNSNDTKSLETVRAESVVICIVATKKKATGFLSVCLAACIGSATIGLIIVKFDIGDFHQSM